MAERRHRAKAAIRREQILTAALELFCEHGYAGTSTRSIAEAAGVTEGLLFHYFGTKEALLLELAARQNTFAGRVLATVEGAKDQSARELLAGLAGHFADVSSQERDLIAFLLAEVQVHPKLRAQIQAGDRVMFDALLELLQARVEAGELRDAQGALEAAILGFFGGFFFFYSQHRDLGPRAWRREAAAFAEAWAEQCWRGLATRHELSEHSK